MPDLRVALLTTSFPLEQSSSSGIFVARLAESLAKDVSVTVITPADQKNTHTISRNGITIRPFRYAPRSWQVLTHRAGGIPVALANNKLLYFLLPALLFSMLIKCIRYAYSSDVVHANWAICGCVAGVAGLVSNVPVVTTLRGDDVNRARVSVLDKFILWLCIRLSARVTVVSRTIESWICDQFPRCAYKVSLIENGVDDRLLRITREKVPLERRLPVRLLTIGSLIPRKGIDQIIQSLALLEDQRKVLLTIIGTGPEKDRLNELVATSGLQESVVFIDGVPPTEVPALLFQADVFILASHSEGRPNVILEAMAAGLPVIGTDIGGINELIAHDQNGLLFQDGDHAMLAKHIEKLVDCDEMRIRLGSAAKNNIISRKLVWANTAQHYFLVYQSLSES